MKRRDFLKLIPAAVVAPAALACGYEPVPVPEPIKPDQFKVAAPAPNDHMLDALQYAMRDELIDLRSAKMEELTRRNKNLVAAGMRYPFPPDRKWFTLGV